MSGSRELFGGAITATLPVTFLDASYVSSKPRFCVLMTCTETFDKYQTHKRSTCLLTRGSASSLKYWRAFPPPTSGKQLGTFARAFRRLGLSTSPPSSQHFDSLAHDNDAKTPSVIEAVEVSNDSEGATPNPIVLYGTQTVQKFNTATADEVRILLALYRVPQKNVDLVMTMNAPMTGSDGDAITEKEWGIAQDAFNTAARSLRIVDYGLFA